jgi:hypothetical protein
MYGVALERATAIQIFRYWFRSSETAAKPLAESRPYAESRSYVRVAPQKRKNPTDIRGIIDDISP